MLNLSNFYPKMKGLFYVVNPTPMGAGGEFKIWKPRGPRGWGICNFENPGDPGGGGLRFSWGLENPNGAISEIQFKYEKVKFYDLLNGSMELVFQKTQKW